MFLKSTLTLLIGTLSVAVIGAPLLYYPMNELETTVINHGSAHDADVRPFLLHQDSFTPGVTGNALRIFGMSDGYRLESPGRIIPGQCTISLYFRPERLKERMTLVSFFMGAEELLALKIQNKHLVLCDWPPKAARQSHISEPELALNEWYHVVWSMDGKNWKLFLNGKEILNVASTSLPGKLPVKTLHIGNDFFPGGVSERDRFVGSLDEFKVFDAPLSLHELEEASAQVARASAMCPAELVSNAIIGADAKELSAKIEPASQSIILNGEKSPMMIYAFGGFIGAGYSYSTVPDIAKEGIHLFRAGVTGGRDFCSGNWWYDDDKYDFEVVDRYMDIVFKQDPEAKILLSVAVSPPDWWGRKHPEEVCKDFQGRMNQDYFASHSYSSQRWLTDLNKALDALFAHMKTRPYYKRIFGVVPVSGRYGECLRAGYNSQLYGKNVTDYSVPEVAAFRAWLQKRYGTIEKMKAAYKSGAVPNSFEEVSIPPPEAIQRPDSSYFVDPVVDRGKIDYYTYVNEQSAEAVCKFTTMIRNNIGPDKIIGLYYGYVLEDVAGHGRAWASDSGHFALGKVLRNAPIDFLSMPVGYSQRQLGSVGPCMSTPASFALHNKVILDEADIRTSLSGGRAEYSGAADLDESLAVLWRTFSNTLVNGNILWWFPISGNGVYSHPSIWSAFGSMYREMQHSSARKITDENKNSIAIIVDEESIHYRRYSLVDKLSGNLVTYSRDVFAKSGIKCDYYISDDLDVIPTDYPVYIFLNQFYADEARRQTIKRLKDGGRLLVWCYGAGFFRAADGAGRLSVSPSNIEDLTGIKVDWRQSVVSLDSAPVKGTSITIPALSLEGKYKPAFTVQDTDAEILACFTDPALANGAAVALKDCGTWQSLYLGTPEFKIDLVRAIAKLGKVHIWSDADNVVVRPGNGHIVVHSGHEESVKLFFPTEVARVFDVTNDKEVACNVKSVTIPMGKNRTVLLRLE